MARIRKALRIARKVRRRRSPELARVELLDAAERLFRDLPPDQVGLKDIAREADVSHALITHYFGTFDGLVESVFERRTMILRARIVERLATVGITEADELIEILFTTFDDPVHIRLMTWLIASERRSVVHALALRDRGISMIAATVATAIDPHATPELRYSVELALVTTVAAAFGYAATKLSLASAIGQPTSPTLDRDVRRTLTAMLQAYLKTGEPVTAR
jgi:AcrR family transcriptional regulator